MTAKYSVQNFTTGKFAEKTEIMNKGVETAYIVTETSPEPSKWKDDNGNAKTQDVCKIKFDGMGDEAYKFVLNRAVINALVQAFGEDSKNWINKPLRVESEKVRVSGKAGVAVYLIPEGFKRIDDEDGYARIVKEEEVGDIPIIEE